MTFAVTLIGRLVYCLPDPESILRQVPTPEDQARMLDHERGTRSAQHFDVSAHFSNCPGADCKAEPSQDPTFARGGRVTLKLNATQPVKKIPHCRVRQLAVA